MAKNKTQKNKKHYISEPSIVVTTEDEMMRVRYDSHRFLRKKAGEKPLSYAAFKRGWESTQRTLDAMRKRPRKRKAT